MGNQTYGYARVSTEQQNLDRQIDALTGYGVDRLYNEKMTGTRKDRPRSLGRCWRASQRGTQ